MKIVYISLNTLSSFFARWRWVNFFTLIYTLNACISCMIIYLSFLFWRSQKECFWVQISTWVIHHAYDIYFDSTIYIYVCVYRYYYVFLRYIESLYLYLVPPNILDEESSPSSVTIRENHNASLQCNAEGTPQPRITWRREDGKKIIIKKKKNAGKKG